MIRFAESRLYPKVDMDARFREVAARAPVPRGREGECPRCEAVLTMAEIIEDHCSACAKAGRVAR